MNAHVSFRPTRRTFLAGAAGLVIGVYLPRFARADDAPLAALRNDRSGAAGQFEPNAFVRIAPDDTVTVLSKHIEMGQGPMSGLAVLVAEELDADWSQIRGEHSPTAVAYKNLAFGDFNVQGTGGSTAIANSYEQMRKAGATARAMLVAAAAAEWGVPAGEITVERGRIRHAGSGKESGFGALATKAATMTPPADTPLKDPKDFKLIGTEVPRLDMHDKTTGKTIFTLDVSLPGMVVALVAHPAQFGATVGSVDDSAARAVKGVIDVKTVPQGVAVYGENTWAALKGRDALKIVWDTSKAETRPSASIIDEYREAAKTLGKPVTNEGDVEAAMQGAKTLEAEYIFPYLAHAPMEPLDAVLAKAEDGSIDVFNGSQLQTMDQQVVAAVLGIDPTKVRVNTQFAGGSFGRRAQAGSPYAAEAAAVFKAFGGSRPVKHMWTREDDIRGGYYRPIYVHRLKGSIGPDGSIGAWDQVVVGQSILAGTPFEVMMKDGIDPTSTEGTSDLPYSIPNRRVSVHNTKTGVPVFWWRSVGHTHTGFTTETFLDELLQAAGKDPVEGRLALLDGSPRHAGVLKRVAEIADWGGPVPEGRSRGVAVHKSFDTYVAEIAEVSLGKEGLPRVHKVWCAVDCGVPVQPNVIKAQMEGGIGYGLGAILFDEITLGEEGRIVQSNFHDYRSLRINEMPDVEVAVIRSNEKPTGVGEPGVPPLGPAVANAWRVLTKASVRSLPFRPLPSA